MGCGIGGVMDEIVVVWVLFLCFGRVRVGIVGSVMMGLLVGLWYRWCYDGVVLLGVL